MNVIIISAVKAETAHIIDELKLEKKEKLLFSDLYCGNLNHINIFLLISGAGAVNTSGALSSAILKFKPDLIIQTGICGAFRNSGLDLSEISLAESETDIQLGLESGDFIDDLPFYIFEDDNFSIRNRIEIDKDLTKQAEYILKSDFRVIKGDFVSASTITTTDEKALKIESKFNPVAESMEGFSAALIAGMCGIKFLEIRSVSNFVGKRDRKSWKVGNACLECSRAVLLYLNNLNQ